MRIDQLTLKHFKGFESKEFSFHPEFNLLVGKNGAGKTSVLDALAVAVGSWFPGIKGAESRHIRPSEVMLDDFEQEELDDQGQRHSSVTWEPLYPCEVAARGEVQGQTIDWSHSLNYPDGAVTNREAVKIIKLASDADEAIRKGKDVSLPLIAYYGTGRLWQEPRNAYQITDPSQVSSKEEQSRFAGYRDSIDPKLSVSQLTRWIVRQSWIAYQRQGRVPPVFEAVKQAMIGCLEGATDLSFDAVIGEVVIAMEEGPQPFSILSDGQRCILAMVGDMAQRAARLNPQYGGKTLQQTTGVVLIDELDLHLHPRWQRRIIEDLRRTFPKIQFICTTHSPFLIQAIEQGQLIQLDSPTEGIGEYANQPIEDIIEFVQGVEIPHLSQSSIELNSAAENYFSLLQDAEANPDQIEQAEAKYRQVAKRYSANPGLSAILELEALARKKREGK